MQSPPRDHPAAAARRTAPTASYAALATAKRQKQREARYPVRTLSPARGVSALPAEASAGDDVAVRVDVVLDTSTSAERSQDTAADGASIAAGEMFVDAAPVRIGEDAVALRAARRLAPESAIAPLSGGAAQWHGADGAITITVTLCGRGATPARRRPGLPMTLPLRAEGAATSAAAARLRTPAPEPGHVTGTQRLVHRMPNRHAVGPTPPASTLDVAAVVAALAGDNVLPLLSVRAPPSASAAVVRHHGRPAAPVRPLLADVSTGLWTASAVAAAVCAAEHEGPTPGIRSFSEELASSAAAVPSTATLGSADAAPGHQRETEAAAASVPAEQPTLMPRFDHPGPTVNAQQLVASDVTTQRGRPWLRRRRDSLLLLSASLPAMRSVTLSEGIEGAALARCTTTQRDDDSAAPPSALFAESATARAARALRDLLRLDLRPRGSLGGSGASAAPPAEL
jgi:hypothetical protein